tara:strand:- start:107 stop:517 length:411 start_codon:yes stop_codon:yes gene_type:complete
MKKLFFLFILFPSILLAQTDTTLSEIEDVNSINKARIDALVRKYKTILRNTGGVEGWRIQVTFKAKREDILPLQIKFSKLYPEIPAQITFDSPYYKLTVGNFRTRNEAIKIKHQINKVFPGAHPVPIIIDPNLLKD